MKDKSTRKVKNNHKKRPKTASDFKRMCGFISR